MGSHDEQISEGGLWTGDEKSALVSQEIAAAIDEKLVKPDETGRRVTAIMALRNFLAQGRIVGNASNAVLTKAE